MEISEDRLASLRERMVQGADWKPAASGIRRVLGAMRDLPRHLFVPPGLFSRGLPRQPPAHRVGPDHQPAVHGSMDDGTAGPAGRREGPGGGDGLRLPGRHPGQAGAGGRQHREARKPGAQGPGAARSRWASPTSGPGGGRVRRPARRGAVRRHHGHGGRPRHSRAAGGTAGGRGEAGHPRGPLGHAGAHPGHQGGGAAGPQGDGGMRLRPPGGQARLEVEQPSPRDEG